MRGSRAEVRVHYGASGNLAGDGDVDIVEDPGDQELGLLEIDEQVDLKCGE